MTRRVEGSDMDNGEEATAGSTMIHEDESESNRYDKYHDNGAMIDVEDVEKSMQQLEEEVGPTCPQGIVFRSYKSQNAAFSVFALNALACFLVANGVLSICSVNAIGSIFSVNSIFWIASLNSILAIGCSGGSMKICIS